MNKKIYIGLGILAVAGVGFYLYNNIYSVPTLERFDAIKKVVTYKYKGKMLVEDMSNGKPIYIGEYSISPLMSDKNMVGVEVTKNNVSIEKMRV